MGSFNPHGSARDREGALMWGYSLDFWQSVVVWTMWLAFALTAVGAAAAVISSFVSYQLSNAVQADADSRIESASIVARQAAIDVARANERAAALEKEAQEARLETARIRQHVEWRRISKEQHDTIVNALAGQSFSVWTSFVGKDPEAAAFRNDIDAVLKNAGITTKYYSGWEVAVGITISEEPASKERDLLVATFKAAKLPIHVAPLRPLGDKAVQIRIGSKPPPF